MAYNGSERDDDDLFPEGPDAGDVSPGEADDPMAIPKLSCAGLLSLAAPAVVDGGNVALALWADYWIMDDIGGGLHYVALAVVEPFEKPGETDQLRSVIVVPAMNVAAFVRSGPPLRDVTPPCGQRLLYQWGDTVDNDSVVLEWHSVFGDRLEEYE